MTEITFYRTRLGEYQSFCCSGHAGYAEYGQDIVCAAISALVINTINSLQELAEEPLETEMDEKQGIIRCALTASPPGEKAVLLMDSLVLGISQIEKQYGKKHCRLKFKEV